MHVRYIAGMLASNCSMQVNILVGTFEYGVMLIGRLQHCIETVCQCLAGTYNTGCSVMWTDLLMWIGNLCVQGDAASPMMDDGESQEHEAGKFPKRVREDGISDLASMAGGDGKANKRAKGAEALAAGFTAL